MAHSLQWLPSGTRALPRAATLLHSAAALWLQALLSPASSSQNTRSSASESIFRRQTDGCFLHEGTSLPTAFGSFMDYSSSLLVLILFIIERAEQRRKPHSLYTSPLLFQPISLKDVITETVNWDY